MRYMTYIPVVPRGGLTERVVHDQLPKTNKSGDCSCTPQQGCFGMGDYSHNNNSSSSSDSLLHIILFPSLLYYGFMLWNYVLFSVHYSES